MGILHRAAIAQLGERQTEDLEVPGSIPGFGTFASARVMLRPRLHRARRTKYGHEASVFGHRRWRSSSFARTKSTDWQDGRAV